MKGQGLPLSFIVIAAISALVLILIVAFTIGGLGGFFKQITIAGGIEDLSTVQTACTTNCNKVQVSTQSITQFMGSDYCKRTFTVDVNKNNKVDTGETGKNCWDATIGIDCTVQTSAGEVFDQRACTVGGYCAVLGGTCKTACIANETDLGSQGCATLQKCCKK